MEYQKMPWRDGGENLLIAFEILIKQYGGRIKLAKDIENDVIRSKIKKYDTRISTERKSIQHYNKNDEAFILANIDRTPNYIGANSFCCAMCIAKRFSCAS